MIVAYSAQHNWEIRDFIKKDDREVCSCFKIGSFLVFKRTLPYEGALTPEEVYASSLLCCAELIRTGSTTL